MRLNSWPEIDQVLPSCTVQEFILQLGSGFTILLVTEVGSSVKYWSLLQDSRF